MKNIQKKIYISIIAIIASALAQPTYANSYGWDKNKDKKDSEVGSVMSDSAITTAINAKFLADPDIKSLRISVETTHGKVKLTGTVPSKAMMERAIQIAKDTRGVKEVVSELEIKPSSKANYIISDTGITTAVKTKLLADPDIKAFDIHVETINGVTTLTGEVPSYSIRDRAIEIAKTVEGVKEVNAQLKIKTV